MTLKKLTTELMRRESKKSQIKIGDMRELLGHLADIIHAEGLEAETLRLLIQYGTKRAGKK